MNIIVIIFIAIITFIFPADAYAHAFGTLYTLPIPLWLYLWGAGAALVISFVAIGFFTRESHQFKYPKFYIGINPWIIFFAKIFSLILFCVVILSGFLGIQSPVQNFAPTFFWIIFLLGLTYLSAIFGNIWDIYNPWKIIVLFFNFKPVIAYPKKLGYFPALIFYFMLIWVEILSSGLGARPQFLSVLLLSYTILNILASALFGVDDWFKFGEFFSVFFGIIAKLSLFSRDDLLKQRPAFFSQLIFILFMLSSTAFDGFRSTIFYFRYFYSINPTLLLFLSPLLFLILYLLAIILMKMLIKTKLSVIQLSLNFAYSLIPIALAYNIAHYFTLLLIQGQTIIPLLSDPLNKGWNLFGSADYQINVGILGASFVWHFEVLAIILGHILAVIFAHMIALKLFPGRRQALISQIPMLILMVCYTIAGLWILSQPLTVGG